MLADVYGNHLPANAPAAARDSVTGAVAIANRLGDSGLLAAGRVAYLDAMSVVLLVCAAVALVGAALTAALLPAQPPSSPVEEESSHDPDEIARLA